MSDSLFVFGVANTSSARTVEIQDPSVAGEGAEVLVTDDSGGAGTHNITVQPTSGLIDGASSAVINANNGSIRLRSDGVQWRVIATVGASAAAAPSVVRFGPVTYTSGDVNVLSIPVPACKVKTMRLRWASVPSGAVVAAWFDNGGGSPGVLLNTSGASGKTSDAGNPATDFAANDILNVTLEEDPSGNPASGAIIEGVIELLAP